jgi:antitoxin (DNA-binding transcriptional repressor) of toxin-antitoxin stability system
VTKLNLAEVNERLDDLVDRVSETGETILFLQSGKPVAKLVPAGSEDEPSHLSDVQGWLEDSDPFFAAIDEIVEARSQHHPRVIRESEGPEAARR